MKKSLILVVVNLFFLCVNNVQAADLNVELDCPPNALANESVTCNILATPSGSDLKGVQANYSITNGTYESLTLNDSFTAYSNSSSGFLVNLNSTIISKVTIGKLKLKMPMNGNLSIKLTNVQGSDSNYNTLSGRDVNATISVSSSINTLSSIKVSSGILTPSFDKNINEYVVEVDTDKISVTVDKDDPTSTVTGTGTYNLKFGDNSIIIKVNSQSGNKREYKLIVKRKDNRSDNNLLSDLSVSGQNITPKFSENNMSYYLDVANDISNVDILATVKDSKATFVNNYGPRNVKLNYGSNIIDIKVKAENESIRVYSLKINRQDNRSSNSDLKQLDIGQSGLQFDKNRLEYNISLEYDVDKINIVAVPEFEKAKVAGTGIKELKQGLNVFEITVTAENGTKKKYVLNITRLAMGEKSLSSDSSLKELIVNNQSVDISKNVNVITLNKKIQKLDISAITNDSNAKIEIKNNYDITDNKIVNIIVTAENGEITNYSLLCVMEKSNVNFIAIIFAVILVEIVNVVIFIYYKKKIINNY